MMSTQELKDAGMLAYVVEHSSTHAVIANGDYRLWVCEYPGPEIGVQGWFVYRSGDDHYTSFIAKCDSKWEAVQYAKEWDD